MKDLIEIRWHGRGGQGAKTAALLLADVAFNNGLFVQGFPEYGPERMGAPITAYNRLGKNAIRVHSNIYEPDYVVIVDETLIDSVDVTAGIREDGAVIVNSSRTADEVKEQLKKKGFEGTVYVLDARKISVDALGRYFPNSPMLAAVVKITGVMEEQAFLEDMKKSYSHKFASKPQVIEGNMKALEMALREVS